MFGGGIRMRTNGAESHKKVVVNGLRKIYHYTDDALGPFDYQRVERREGVGLLAYWTVKP